MGNTTILLGILVIVIIVLIALMSNRRFSRPSRRSKEGYYLQNNPYSFMYTKDNNNTYHMYRYNGQVPRFAYSDYFI
jgi:hypothetical protein